MTAWGYCYSCGAICDVGSPCDDCGEVFRAEHATSDTVACAGCPHPVPVTVAVVIMLDRADGDYTLMAHPRCTGAAYRRGMAA